MTVFVHPFADEWTDEYVLLLVEHSHVTLSTSVRSFLENARETGRKPVLLTGPDATLSAPLVAAMRRLGAYWALRTAEGFHDARSGLRIDEFPQLWRGELASITRLPQFEQPDAHALAGFAFDVFARGRADDRTTVGDLAAAMAVGLGGGPFDRWGVDEPLAEAWDVAALTRSVQQQMPLSRPHYAAAPGGATATTTVARTRTGILEHATGLVPIGPYADVDPAALAGGPEIALAMRMLMDAHRPTIAIVSLTELAMAPGERLAQRAGARRSDLPLAALIGPRAVRDLDLDFAKLAERHDVQRLGPGRVPSALVRFTGRDELWHQLLAFAHDLDNDRLLAALQAERPEGPRA